jgi:four helix bundle protein
MEEIGNKRVSSGEKEMNRGNYLEVEDLEVYKKLCRLHIEVCELTGKWPQEEKYKLASQVRRSSNSAPAQLAEKNDARHIRNKIEGVNRARGESAETIHHLFMARLKGYITEKIYLAFRERYKECIRMLNGLEKTLERKVPERDRRWHLAEEIEVFEENCEFSYKGWPITAEPDPETRNLTPETFIYARRAE